MKRVGGDGIHAGVRRPRAEDRPGSPRSGWLRPLALAAPPSAEAIRSVGFTGARARDFEDFVEADGGFSALVRTRPDPGFREGLRRRLWRIHVLKRAHRGFERN
ncbi:MAG: hypothetical protein U0900_01290 [Myxococcota bacterium]